MTATLTAAPPHPLRPEPPQPSRGARLLRGRPADPAWARPALLALLGLTALLYLWDLGASGTANSFYAAAVQAGTQSWKAMFFGSLDPGNVITVDKPAFFLWPMEIAGRIFGFTSWSMLAPQALEGVAAVGLLAATVRRLAGPAAGLLAGAALALTPVAALMFRFNNPDAMLTLLLVASAYATVRALAAAKGRWLALAGVLIGLGFITKMGQALLVLPVLALTYVVAAPTSLGRRIRQLLAAGVAMLAGAGWYIAIVDLWPASSRPYIGGSTTNSLLELALGYNGLGRLLGSGAGNGGGGAFGGTAFGGATGVTRLFSGDMATEISWLLPTALLALVVGLWATWRAPRTDHLRAGLLLFGGWLLVTAGIFSYMKGTIHPYYTVALAPAVGGTIAMTAVTLWQRRTQWPARVSAALLVALTAGWDFHLLGLTPTFLPSLRWLLLAAAALAVTGLLFGRRLRVAAAGAVIAALLAGFGGSAAYAVGTAARPHTGSIPSSGPATSSGGPGAGGPSGRPAGAPSAGGFTGGVPTGTFTGGGAGAAGGAGGDTQTDTALVVLLKATTTRWAAAAVGAQSAAPLQLASGKAVMSLGGFTGSDPAPTLAQFQAYVRAGEVRYFLGSGTGGGFGSRGGSSSIATWVAAHYRATTVGGVTVYDLTAATS